MPENIKLSFDDGYKTIEFNGDPNKIIRINPTDMAFVNRIASLSDNAKAISEKYGDINFDSVRELKNLDSDDPDFEKMKEAAETLDKVEKSIRELIDSTFESPVCDIVFGKTSCISPAGGMPIYLNFIGVIFEFIKTEMEKQNAKSEAKMSKYTKQAKEIPTKPMIAAKPAQPFIPLANPQTVDISSLSKQERNELLRQLLT
jgi:hypothetical protein